MKRELTFRPRLISKQRRYEKTPERQDRCEPRNRRHLTERGHCGRDARLLQLSQPKRRVYETMRQETAVERQEAADLAECSFRPKTGRPPENRRSDRSVEERLYHARDGRTSAL